MHKAHFIVQVLVPNPWGQLPKKDIHKHISIFLYYYYFYMHVPNYRYFTALYNIWRNKLLWCENLQVALWNNCCRDVFNQRLEVSVPNQGECTANQLRSIVRRLRFMSRNVVYHGELHQLKVLNPGPRTHNTVQC